MSPATNKTLAPIIASTLLLGSVTVFCLLNKGTWPMIIPLGLALGIFGIALGRRSDTLDPNLEKTRVRVVLGTLITSIVIFIVTGILASTTQGSGLTIMAVIALLPILFPLYYGLAQLLAIAFVPEPKP